MSGRGEPFESEWEVYCPNGHRDFLRFRHQHRDDVPKVTDCPVCPEQGVPRRARRLSEPK